jgi:hypothetical protein
METYVAAAILMALLAVGALLMIKIARRREATRTGAFGGTVPAKPLSAQDAQRMTTRYAIVAARIIAATAACTVWVAVGAS